MKIIYGLVSIICGILVIYLLVSNPMLVAKMSEETNRLFLLLVIGQITYLASEIEELKEKIKNVEK